MGRYSALGSRACAAVLPKESMTIRSDTERASDRILGMHESPFTERPHVPVDGRNRQPDVRGDIPVGGLVALGGQAADSRKDLIVDRFDGFGYHHVMTLSRPLTTSNVMPWAV